jgi:hypothetical protein
MLTIITVSENYWWWDQMGKQNGLRQRHGPGMKLFRVTTALILIILITTTKTDYRMTSNDIYNY